MYRHRLLDLWRRRLVAHRAYLAQSRMVRPEGLVDIWPFNEASGATAIAAINTARNAAYRNGATPGTAWPTASGFDLFTAPALFGATSDILFPASMAAVTNWNEGSVSFLMRATAASWDDATLRRPWLWQVNGSNRIYLQKSAGVDTLVAFYIGGGTTISITVNNVTQYCGTGWLHVVLVWSKSGDYFRLYLNGKLVGSASALPTITGTLAIAAIAGNPYHPNSTYAWHQFWTVPLTQADVTALRVPIVRDRLLVFEGDSLTVGGQLGAIPYPKQLMRAIPLEVEGHMVAASGETVATMITQYESQVAPLYRPQSYRRSVLVVMGGTNDIQSVSPETTYARLQTLWAAGRATGFDVVAVTLPAGNPAGFPTYNTARNALNTLMLSDQTLYSAVARPDLNANIGQDGDENNTTYFNSDKVHLTTAGYGQLESTIRTVLP